MTGYLNYNQDDKNKRRTQLLMIQFFVYFTQSQFYQFFINQLSNQLNNPYAQKQNNITIFFKQINLKNLILILKPTPSMKGSTKRISRFNFTYHDLAYKVRQNMFQALQTFDSNLNGLFQQPQIIQALTKILGEDQNELRYVISNVFRYDRDGDRAVTYEEFVNFAVEQHFGEMAIQRLHKRDSYSRGRERVMNFNQFCLTLNQSLKHINSQGTTEEYQHLFGQLDLDRDGWIKYEDYFMFLREYFGSLSVAANQPQAIVPKQQPKAQPIPDYVPQIQFAEQRFARLIYTQLKISVMQHDLSRSLSLNRDQIGAILTNVFRIRQQQKEQLINLIVGQQQVISYEKFMKVMVPFYFCEYDVQKAGIGECSQEYFVHVVQNAAAFVQVRPSAAVLKEIFRRADVHKKGFLERTEYINTLGMILENYEFDTRGTGKTTY